MKEIASKTVWYPAFPLIGTPIAVQTSLRCLETDDGRRFLKTPFAMLDWCAGWGDEIPNEKGYYDSREEVESYLRAEYPHEIHAQPIRQALLESRYHYGTLVGTGRIADRLGVSSDEIFPIARGHRSVKLKTIKALAKLIGE